MKLRQNTDTPVLAPEDLDEIRATVDWQSLFYGLGLKKAERKSRPMDWWAFSPFHDEKTPSFHMGPGGVWYDFSVGEGGGPIELVQQLKHCNCFEAGRFILEGGWARATIDISPPRKKSAGYRRRVGKMLGEAENSAENIPDFRNAAIRQDLLPLCQYHPVLEERGISEETCDLLGIGYLPQGRSPMKGRIVFQVADARPGKSGDGGGDSLDRVVLSHIGRATEETQQPKYLFYEGFHKSAELYGQEILLLHEDARRQVEETGHILVTEGPMDVAKAMEAGYRNIVGTFGATLSGQQASKLKTWAERFGVSRIRLAYDRDDAGKRGAEKAAVLLRERGLQVDRFDWDAPIGKTRKGAAHIPPGISDLGDLSVEQLQWLRARGLL